MGIAVNSNSRSGLINDLTEEEKEDKRIKSVKENRV